MNTISHLLIAGALLAVAAGCGEGGTTAAAPATTQQAAAPPPTNRIDIPESVRQNLGITFAKVEQRPVAATSRVPGRFELLPSARREYRATLPGWIEPLVEQYAPVKKGAAIYKMDSPEWHRIRKELHEGQAGIAKAQAELEVAQRATAEAETVAAAMQKRIEALAGAEVRRAELEAELAQRRAAVPRLEAETKVKQAGLDEARHDFDLNLASAASLLGTSPAHLTEPVEGSGHADEDHKPGGGVPRWFALSHVGLEAQADGLVESVAVTRGSWAEANALVATAVDPAALRFRAVGLQSDLSKLRDGLSVKIVPALSDGISPNDHITGTLAIGLNADPDRRTIDLVVTLPPGERPAWTRNGVSAFLEIAIEQSGAGELAVPQGSVVQDELNSVIFRRDPKDPNKVIRMEADLGVSDGRWVAIRSGVKAGDEVVLNGAYDLNLMGGGKTRGEGGHFHPDGTYHAGPD